MKKLTTLALAAGLIVAAAAPASAIDTKVDGQYLYTFNRQDMNFQKDGGDQEFVKQRLRLGLTFTASESLSGYAQFQSEEFWGQYHNKVEPNTGLRQLYVNWMIPGTPIKVRMGKIQFGMPTHAFGQNLVMGPANSRYGVILSAPVADWMDVSAYWHRHEAGTVEGTIPNTVSGGENDVFGLSANLKFDGISFTPWVLYGHNTIDDKKADTVWGEVTANLTMFDPLTVKATIGGATSDAKSSAVADIDAWYGMAVASYKMSFGTPVLGFWYGSGADKGETIAESYVPSLGGKVAPGTTFNDGVYGLDAGLATNINGTWGVKLGIQNISFIEGLTHDVAVLMWKGTNHDSVVSKAPVANMRSELAWTDTIYEFDFGTTYQIYKNLTANLELAYLLNDLNEDLHAGYAGEDGWRTALTFQYKF